MLSRRAVLSSFVFAALVGVMVAGPLKRAHGQVPAPSAPRYELDFRVYGGRSLTKSGITGAAVFGLSLDVHSGRHLRLYFASDGTDGVGTFYEIAQLYAGYRGRFGSIGAGPVSGFVSTYAERTSYSIATGIILPALAFEVIPTERLRFFGHAGTSWPQREVHTVFAEAGVEAQLRARGQHTFWTDTKWTFLSVDTHGDRQRASRVEFGIMFPLDGAGANSRHRMRISYQTSTFGFYNHWGHILCAGYVLHVRPAARAAPQPAPQPLPQPLPQPEQLE